MLESEIRGEGGDVRGRKGNASALIEADFAEERGWMGEEVLSEGVEEGWERYGVRKEGEKVLDELMIRGRGGGRKEEARVVGFIRGWCREEADAVCEPGVES